MKEAFADSEALKQALENYISSEGFLRLDLLTVSTVPTKNLPEQAKIVSLIQSLGSSIEISHREIFDPLKTDLLNGVYEGLGPDRAAKLIGAQILYPGRNIILMDFGTATTLSAADSKKNFLGGFISLGFKSTLQALADQTACLPNLAEFDFSETLPTEYMLRSQQTSKAIIQGSYLAHLGLIKTWLEEARSWFDRNDEKPLVIAAGGLAKLFSERDFDEFIDDAVLLSAFAEKMQELGIT